MKLLVVLLSVLAMSGAAATFATEYRAAAFARSTDMAAFTALADGAAPQTPFSNRALREVLLTCGAVQQGLVYALQPPKVQGRVNTSCTQIATTALQRNPTFAAAHTILMQSATAPDTVTNALIRSQATGPFEAWHAKIRLQKGLPFHATGNAAVDHALTADILFLVQSPGGRRWLAHLYQDQIAQRPVIVATVKQRPPAEQAAFLQEVKTLGHH